LKKNTFGGRFGSAYTPMSEDEQEVISRLKESADLMVVVKGWREVKQPVVTFGDLRVSISFRLHFDRPEVPVPLHFLDLELRTGSGMLLFKERQGTVYNGNPIQVADGVYLDMVWDIAIMSMDPKMVKLIKPGAIGLTSRWQDKDTGDVTVFGNSDLDHKARAELMRIRKGEQLSRRIGAERVREAEEKSKKS
jgi:hypothetical protein